MIQFFVPGIPAPGGSKKAFPIHTGRFKPSKKTGKPIEIIKVAVMDAGGQANKHWRLNVIEACRSVFTSVPLAGPLKMNVVFYLPYRKGDFGTGKNRGVLKQNSPIFATTRPDLLKILRSTEDALTGILWNDDSQVVQVQAGKMYSLRPGALIQIFPLSDESANILLPQPNPSSIILP